MIIKLMKKTFVLTVLFLSVVTSNIGVSNTSNVNAAHASRYRIRRYRTHQSFNIVRRNYRFFRDATLRRVKGVSNKYIGKKVMATSLYRTKYGWYYSTWYKGHSLGCIKRSVGYTYPPKGDPFYDPDYDPNFIDPYSTGYSRLNHNLRHSIKVTDIDSISHKAVASRFKLEDNEGNVVRTGTTNHGVLIWTNVPDAYYSVHESSAQKGYERLHIARAANLNHQNASVNFRDFKLSNKKTAKGTSSLTRTIKYAESLMHTPYFFGNKPGYLDCSSFVQKVFLNATGVNLPRTTYYQYPFAPKVYSQSKAKPGDLVFFHENPAAQQFYIDHHESEMDYAKDHPHNALTRSMFSAGNPDWSVGHVGIYLGNGQMIDCQVHGGVIINPIHAPWWHVAGFNRPISRWNY